MHHDAEHQHRDDHLDQLDEAVAQRLELDGEVREEQARHDAEHQRDDHLTEEEIWRNVA